MPIEWQKPNQVSYLFFYLTINLIMYAIKFMYTHNNSHYKKSSREEK